MIGAGDTAMDAARVSIRLGAEEAHIVYRRSEQEMGARAEDYRRAAEEGAIFDWLTLPTRVLADEDGCARGLECVRTTLGEPDESGRRRPVVVPGSEFVLEANLVVVALGTNPNPLVPQATAGLETDAHGCVVTDPETGATSRDRRLRRRRHRHRRRDRDPRHGSRPPRRQRHPRAHHATVSRHAIRRGETMENITAESTGSSPPSVGADTLFEDRYDAARRLAADLPSKLARDTVVVAVSHGGAEVAAEVARTLHVPLDIVVVRKIRHPQAPERVLGAVAPGYAVYVRPDTGLTDRQVAIATADARREVDVLDARLHAGRDPIAVAGRRVLLVDDGITTGARMIAATRWARTQRARKVAAAVPTRCGRRRSARPRRGRRPRTARTSSNCSARSGSGTRGSNPSKTRTFSASSTRPNAKRRPPRSPTRRVVPTSRASATRERVIPGRPSTPWIIRRRSPPPRVGTTDEISCTQRQRGVGAPASSTTYPHLSEPAVDDHPVACGAASASTAGARQDRLHCLGAVDQQPVPEAVGSNG